MLLHLSTHQHSMSTKNNNDYDKMTLASGLGGQLGWLWWFGRENEKFKLQGLNKKYFFKNYFKI